MRLDDTSKSPPTVALSFVRSIVNPHAGTAISRTFCGAKMEDNIKDLSRPQMYLFGCSLKADKKEYKVELDDDEAEHQLSLKAVCLGTEAEDKFHTVEMEGLTYDGKMTKITLAVLKPSVLPSLSLGGFEVTPPVSFRLRTGGGPVYISGQHFVSVKESDDEAEEEEENNTSPVKRPSNMTLTKVPQKKLKMDSDEDEDEDSEEDDDDEEDDDKEEKTVKKSPIKTPQKAMTKQATLSTNYCSLSSRLFDSPTEKNIREVYCVTSLKSKAVRITQFTNIIRCYDSNTEHDRFWYSIHIPFPNCQDVPTKSQGLPLDARDNSYQTSRCSLERRRHGSLTEKTTG
ncbi:Nucleophosmin [Anabarilius grahami]|uniref:Nucleophosmin n=1 Tax=Anabarilius grahami TaxID=495550 RepID=A0A3N0XKS0_ANAGA|nr:Nucleophosmin [Anabarilius grahami]